MGVSDIYRNRAVPGAIPLLRGQYTMEFDTAAGDGYMNATAPNVFADVRNAAGAGSGSTVVAAYQVYAGTTYYFYRSLLIFDTSPLPDNANILSATLYMTPKDYATPGQKTHLVATSLTAVATAGYALANWGMWSGGAGSAGYFGPTVTNDTEVGAAIDLKYIRINPTGNTYIGLVGDRDLLNAGGAQDLYSNNWYCYADAAAKRPRLVVTYQI